MNYYRDGAIIRRDWERDAAKSQKPEDLSRFDRALLYPEPGRSPYVPHVPAHHAPAEAGDNSEPGALTDND